jgi:hypothetical protein
MWRGWAKREWLKVYMAKVEVSRENGMPKLRWIDGVKAALEGRNRFRRTEIGVQDREME